ncbi:MAG: hypothetical protein FK733_19345 [Asgard group archaeon]|nr:hypothetical protein [Asgard group archaeon]
MSNPANPLESKVVILGLSQSGKTSIRQVVFEGFTPEATALNPATVRINRKLFNLAGGGINLFDIGGQTNYLNEVFQQYQDRTFTNVKAAIFVVDVSDAANLMRSKYYFDLTLKSVLEIATNARIYVFAHKIDVVPMNKREAIIQSISEIFEVDNHDNVEIFATSIFDETVLEAMQKVLSFVYPRDDAKTTEIKKIVSSYDLAFLALSTSQGLVLYSEPEVVSGVNFARLKSELGKAYFPGLYLTEAIFNYGEFNVFMKELTDDLVITSVFPKEKNLAKAQQTFTEMTGHINTLFNPDELMGQAKIKIKKKLVDFLKAKSIKKVQALEDKFDNKILVKCDMCGKQVQKSLLDVSVENAENIERGIKVNTGFGTISIEIYPVHECVEGIREIPIILDENLEYRRYDKSRPI